MYAHVICVLCVLKVCLCLCHSIIAYYGNVYMANCTYVCARVFTCVCIYDLFMHVVHMSQSQCMCVIYMYVYVCIHACMCVYIV